CPQPVGAALAKLGPRPAVGQLAVHEHGKLELVAKEVTQHERLGARGASVPLTEIDDRRHVDRSDPRVLAPMACELYSSDRLPGAVGCCPGQCAGRPGQGEHAAMMIRVAVNVQETYGGDAARERGP